MARNRFDSLSGGLVDSVIAGVGSQVSGVIQSVGTGQQASFSINSALGGAVESASGYALNQGQNYLVSQLSSSLGNSTNNALVNSVVTQVATAGINKAVGFVSQGISNLFTGGSNVTTAGLGAQAARSTISIPDSVASQLEDADYGGSTYTLSDIVFTLVPANAGAQTQQPPQTAPTTSWDVGFDEKAAASLPALDSLKGATALGGPSQGIPIGGKNFGAAYSTLGGRASQVVPVSNLRLEPLW
jgi:hypothetical protein